MPAALAGGDSLAHQAKLLKCNDTKSGVIFVA